MEFKSEIFNNACLDIGNENHLHLLNIEEIDSRLKTYIDERLVSVCEGASGTNLDLVKERLIDFLKSKKESTLEMGAIAEFFAHLYLTEMGFKQEFLFLNLEEGSIKKGFDGYYSYSDEEWIYESKSGTASTKNISHKNKVNESYNDLKEKISGNVKNNPWHNAYNHASHIDVGSAEDIRKNIKLLSEGFTNKQYYDIKDFNVMPGSTIFLEGNWEEIKSNDLKSEIDKLVENYKYKKINILCINKKSVSLFLDYLHGR
tara:strand:- start:66332 stop:67108 length:777 start_codon:yes stop_codon:yes gene_type:complete